MFLMPDGQELSLNGPAITISDYGQPNSPKTVLSLVTGKGGSEVLVMDGVSKTLGIDDMAGPHTRPPGALGAEATGTATDGHDAGATGHSHSKPSGNGTSTPAKGAAGKVGRGWLGVLTAACAVSFVVV
jgi:hypothetical protein